MADTLGSVVIQDLTYTQKRHGIDAQISYLNGGVAGSEVVTVVANHIRVRIASGTSTAIQIKTAVEAHYEASLLVSVTISGTGSNVQVSSVSAALSGGTVVATASLVVDAIKFTAVTAGTAGNSVRIKLIGGATAGSEVVTVATNDIEIQIEEGVSTYAQVKTAYDLVGAAVALATTSSSGLALTRVAKVAHCPTYTNLAGGIAATAAAVVVQDLTYAADATGVAANGKTITYTPGATAGAEVVTVTSGNVDVQIQNGVSTATQIETALNLVAGFTSVYNVTVSGTGSNVQKTVNSASFSGEATPSLKDYYSNQSIVALTTSFVSQRFGFHAQTILLRNDETSGSDTVSWSFDGATVDGVLKPGESIILDRVNNGIAVISLKSNAAADYRLTVVGV
jgi:hypothetical protein